MTDQEKELIKNAKAEREAEENFEENFEKDFEEDKPFMLLDIFKHLEEQEEPEHLSWKGEIDDLGRPGKQFKLYLEGLDDMNRPGLTELLYTNPKNHIMYKAIQLSVKVRRFGNINDMDVDFFDQIIDFVVKNYQVSRTYLEKINPIGYSFIIAFASGLASPPSKNKM